jgi:PAS domain S-box-containing protein
MTAETEITTAPSTERDPPMPQPPGGEVFRVLVEAVQDYAIFLLSPDGHVLTWNPGAQRTKGYSPDEIVGRHFSVFYTPEDQAAHRPARLLRTAAEQGRVEDEGWRVRRDGTRFWADVVLTALRDETGTVYAYAKITRDLTERIAAEEQRRSLMLEQRARSAAEESLLARDRFLSIASHELKTPVASLRLAAESLVRAHQHGRLDERRLTSGLARVMTSTQRLGSLVDELLDVSRLTADVTDLVRTPTDLVALVDEVILRFDDGEVRRIHLDAPTRLEIDADGSRLDQVITNLVDNAMKYSPADQPIVVQVADGPDAATITVTDRGIGVEPATRASLFDAFSRGSNAEHVNGLGLGLFISHQIVERHGGSIETQPGADGTGTTFVVRLPKDVA